MKQLKLRFRVLAFVVIGLLALAGVYGVYSVSTYGSRWISSTRNTRYRSAKSSVIPGDIIDRRGVVVATTDENGERIYQSNILSRSSMCTCWATTKATSPTAWIRFRPTICWALKRA